MLSASCFLIHAESFVLSFFIGRAMMSSNARQTG